MDGKKLGSRWDPVNSIPTFLQEGLFHTFAVLTNIPITQLVIKRVYGFMLIDANSKKYIKKLLISLLNRKNENHQYMTFLKVKQRF